MKIGIDARPLTVQNFTGIPNYVYQICIKWMEKHPEHEYYLMARRPICFKQEELPDNWHIVDDPWIIDKGKFWFLFKLPSLIKQHKLDVFWGPNYTLPRKVKGPKYFLSIMDMAIFKFKHVGQWKNSLQIKLFLKKNAKKSERIIVISESTKRDVVDILKVPSYIVDVTYIAGDTKKVSDINKNLDNNNQAITVCNSIRPELTSLGQYFLFIGTIEPRKNIITIIDGFEKYCEKTGNTEVRLVLAGGRGWNCDNIYSRVKNSRFTKQIIMPGFVSDFEKEYLYKNARAFVYPSLYEGFGMPILEAFKYETPVITARNSSLPEVGKDAAYYIETYDSEGLCNLLDKVTNQSEEELCEIKRLMKAQLESFSWDKCAEETLEIITNKE